MCIRDRTENALEPSLESFLSVANERVLAEFTKMIGGDNFESALSTAMDAKVFEAIFPNVQAQHHQHIKKRATRLPKRLDVQLLSILWNTELAEADAFLKKLTVSNQVKKAVLQGLSHGQNTPDSEEMHACRVFLSPLDRSVAEDVLRVWTLILEDQSLPQHWTKNCQRVLENNDPLKVRDLDIKGKDLLSECGFQPGPYVGDALRRCLDVVLQEPKKNKKTTLLETAKNYLNDLKNPL